MPIDVKSVVGAVVCFSLSSVWKYGLCCRPIRMITCRGLNMAKHLIVELEAVLLEKGKSSKDLVRATGHTT